MAVSILDFREQFPSLTNHIDNSSIDALISVVKECAFSEGDTVIQDNTSSDKLFFILNGYLSSFIEINGEKIKLGEISPGDIAGEVSMFGNCPTTSTVMAKTDCTLFTLSKADLDQLQTTAPEFVGQLLRTTTSTLASRLLGSDKLLYQRFADK
ncbi:cyclic nucleotide-binding domain-containing protein, partial [bacterium]|nr:cyclic nucleotide-binding domain-containing protein [bacterium]